MEPSSAPQLGRRAGARRFVDLVAFKTWADLRAETERTYLGFLWWLLEPLMFLGVFYLVFGLIRGRNDEGFVSFLLVGLVFWQWFRSGVAHAGDSVFNSLYLLRQIKIPAWILPVTVIAADTVKFLMVLTLLVVILALLGNMPGVSLLGLVPVLVAELLLVLGVGLVYAAICPFVRDLRFVMDTFLTALMFLSGIFFDISEVPEGLRPLFVWNPVAALLSDARLVLLESRWPDWGRLAATATFASMLVAAGVALLVGLQRRYSKLAV